MFSSIGIYRRQENQSANFWMNCRLHLRQTASVADASVTPNHLWRLAMSKSKPAGKPTTAAATARIQHAVTVKNGGQTPKGSYVGRMQRTVAQTRTAVLGAATQPHQIREKI